jgi:trans-aconitate 2-methyltransferase
VYDLGCGVGNVTVFLKKRWPEAAVTGIDSSPEMLDRARAAAPDIAWQTGDLSTWTPAQSADLLYSNAALHWLDAHEALFPRLAKALNTGGALAVQMPQNFGAPSHTSIGEVVRSSPWRMRVEPHHRVSPTLSAERYYSILRPHVATLDLWETTYYHVLQGDNPVVEWTKGTTLRPILAQLNEQEGADFLARYGALVRAAYPPGTDGKTILPFKRLFIVAMK